MPKAPLHSPVSEADAPNYAANLRRATLASTVGSALEYYDFAVYRHHPSNDLHYDRDPGS